MTFASLDFLLWLLVALVVYHALPARCRPFLLLLYSVAFYLTWSVAHTLLLSCVTLATWALALVIDKCRNEKKRRLWLALGLCVPLGLLLFFKSLHPLDRVLSSLSPNSEASFRFTDILVPLGISFYAFKLIGYLLDVYWERTSAETNLIILAAHVFFFPQILCGPIQRAADFAEQVRQLAVIPGRIVLEGMVLIALGFLKKFVADQLTYPVDVVFDHPQTFPGLATWAAAYLFTLQLYLDFSGYSDMAVGLGKLFGIDAPVNFAGPLLAGNIQEFWKRWHISLTSWMRDYFFTPCHLSLRNWGMIGLLLSVLINMTLIGLWHNFTRTFLIFGLMHACFMILYILTKTPRAFLKSKVPAWPLWSWLLTFHGVVLGFIIFHAKGLPVAWHLVTNLWSRPISPIPVPWFTVALVVLLALVCQLSERNTLRWPRSEVLRYGFLAAVMVVLFCFSTAVSVSFLYQKF